MNQLQGVNPCTPDVIEHLDPNQVFVFGSNLSGIHGAGAAKTALKWGAEFGKGYGMYGQTFALPTKDKNIRSLPIPAIKNYVNSLIMYAIIHPELEFLVTKVGCGLAGFTEEQIAPLFAKAQDFNNIWLPKEFIKILNA